MDALKWKNNQLILIDQRKLPVEEVFVTVKTLEECHDAIRDMVVRGAPLIGFSAIYGMALWAAGNPSPDSLDDRASYLKNARPTAVNLVYEVDRCLAMIKEWIQQDIPLSQIAGKLADHAANEIEKIREDNLTMAKIALAELRKHYPNKEKLRLMTLCNTGYLACGPMGTALGVIEYAHNEGALEHVYASETRPYLQGSRLTSYELTQLKIPHQITVEGAMSYLLGNGLVDAIFVGADRVVANGDAANKVGTSTLSIVAKHYGIPFYVVAPTSSFDLSLPSGDKIEIELRDENEILSYKNLRIAPEGARAMNPSFDVSDHRNITGVICEKGLISPPSTETVEGVLNG